MRTRIARRVLWAVGAGALLAPIFDDPPLHSGAFVQDVGQDHAIVAMITRQPERLMLAVINAGGQPIAVPAEAEPVRRHRFRLSGLRAAQVYRYRVLDEAGSERDAGAVRTAPDADDAPVRFAVVGDSGGQPWWVWLQRSAVLQLPARWDWLPPSSTVASIGARIAAAEPDFVVHVGDIVYPWGHQGHYSTGFFRPFADTLRRSPFFLTLGNHDVLDDDGRQALANFDLPVSAATGDERCYSFAWGAIRVTVLDLGLQNIEAGRIGPGHPAREFLAQQLAVATEPWQIVVSHYPIFSASRQRDSRADLQQEILPLLEEHGVDLYLSGHDHTYQRFGDATTVVQVVSGGGGKSLYDVVPDRRAKVAQSRYHWCSVEVRGRSLTLRSWGVEGDLIDTVALTKDPAGARELGIQQRNPLRWARIQALR